LRWTRRLFHNLFEDVQLKFNELTLHELDNYVLDFKYEYNLPDEKRIAYNNMIGDVSAFTSPHALDTAVGTGGALDCILPFFFSEDHGLALPVAALPFNDITVVVNYRDWQDLVIIDNGIVTVGTPRDATVEDVYIVDTNNQPSLENPEYFGMYAVVHNDERVKMGDAPRDILMKQIQLPQNGFVRDLSTPTSFDLRLSHSVIALYYVYRNTSIASEWSNYSTEPYMARYVPSVTTPAAPTGFYYAYTSTNVYDPIAHSELRYENTVRYAMDSDFFSLVAPIMFSDAAPHEAGYHVIPYSLHLQDNDPMGSTNYSKLANVSLENTASAAALLSGASTESVAVTLSQPEVSDELPNLIKVVDAEAVDFPQTFQFILRAENWQICRVAHGSIGLPVL
jgi:hypothetical protein